MDLPFVLVYLFVLALLHPVFLAIVLVGGMILVLVALVSERMVTPVLAEGMGLSMRAHAFAEDGLRNSSVLEGMGTSRTFCARWHRHWLDSLHKTTQALDRDSQDYDRKPEAHIFVRSVAAWEILPDDGLPRFDERAG